MSRIFFVSSLSNSFGNSQIQKWEPCLLQSQSETIRKIFLIREFNKTWKDCATRKKMHVKRMQLFCGPSPTHWSAITSHNPLIPIRKQVGSFFIGTIFSFYPWRFWMLLRIFQGKLPLCLKTETCEYRWMGMYSCCKKNIDSNRLEKRRPIVKPLIRESDNCATCLRV